MGAVALGVAHAASGLALRADTRLNFRYNDALFVTGNLCQQSSAQYSWEP